MSSRHRSAEDLTVSGIITHASIGKAEFNLGRHDFEEIDVDIRCETGRFSLVWKQRTTAATAPGHCWFHEGVIE